MKSVRMFILRGCPYCRNALQWMEGWMKQYPAYREIPMEVIDESEQDDVARAHDYFLVPTWYVDGIKVHEGAATRDVVRRVLDLAMEEGK